MHATVPNATSPLVVHDASAEALPSSSDSFLAICLAALAVYATICSIVRRRFERLARRTFVYPDRDSMASMTNDDAQKILKYIMTYEFPFMYKTSLQFAIFKTYGFETMSRLMAKMKTFTDPATAPKRYEDTTVLFAEFSLNPPSSERCIKSISRMNYLHSQYKNAGKISNADFLYTLSVCVTEPIRFMKLYEWRELNDMEVNAIGTFWKSIGDGMEIEYKGFLSQDSWKDGIEFAEDITAWAKKYEIEAMKPAMTNRMLGAALIDLLIYHLPTFIKPFAIQVICVLMGDRLREAFLYPEANIFAGVAAYSALLIRRFFLHYLMLPRWSPRVYLSEPDPKTGRIHHHDYLVEPFYSKSTLWNRWGPMALLTRVLGGYVPGPAFAPQGYLFEDIGPRAQFGRGKEAMETWEKKLKQERPSGCPFSR